ncbi:MAG: hypothetical protein LUC96_05745 [Alistipes sp.]|uniref:hypothetical protein n=1 Tax=Alistipes sp. TaxID=1872444 RepID=UPI0025BF46AC|nr:hypothetical protein [Alistipes sp.]MCD8274474.1 hypothetical protein [Alistipes sp.]
MKKVGILSSRHECLVVRSAISVGILVCTEIAITVNVLRRSIDAHPAAVVRTGSVEFQSAAVDPVVQLFGDIGHVGWLVELPPTAKLVDMMVNSTNGLHNNKKISNIWFPYYNHFFSVGKMWGKSKKLKIA